MPIVLSLICAFALTVAAAECVRALQGASYRPNRGYVKIFVTWYYLSLAVVQAASIFLLDLPQYYTALLYVALAACWTVVSARRKSPLKLTKRALRIFAVQFVLLGLLCVFVGNGYWVWLLPAVTLASWAVCLPADCAITRYYINKARRKLADSRACIIAITGSYGKTTVKDMLNALLDGSIAPSGSCNTPAGIAKFVNGTDISAAKYVILEFGARQKGDIKQLCKLFSPSYGIVTGVCAQHLSTFGSLNGVIAAKRELPECLPESGWCILNAADGIAMQYVNAGKCAKYPSDTSLSVTAANVGYDGTTLDVRVNGASYAVKLPQIADYAADALAMCMQATLLLKQDVVVTLANAARVKQTPHRMQIYPAGDIYIVDDGYNASITGVKSCCRTLQKFTCAKAVITQGLVECGKQRRQLNVQCGKLLGQTCDVAVVVGRNTRFIAEGLIDTDCKILFAKDLSQAVQKARPYVAGGGILLFQNDLPDSVAL